MTEIDWKKVEAASPIMEIATELGIRVRGSVGQCFNTDNHQDDGDTWTLYFKPAKNTFFCKTCENIGGGVVDLVCQHQGWNREKAAEWLLHRDEFDRQTQRMYHGKGKKKQ